MSENKRRRDESVENQAMSENKRPREESVENEPLSENERSSEQSVEKRENEQPDEETEQNEPLDLRMKKKKLLPSAQKGLKMTRTSVWDAAAKAKAEKPPVKKETEEKDDEEETGAVYPIDIWFLIADYINPENVGKFARICKATLSVTDTAVFWLRLFKRYCRPGKDFPGHLTPGAVEERFALRCTVIKALHAVYEPFILKRLISVKQPDLRYRQVVGEWCEGLPSRSDVVYSYELRDITFKKRLTEEDGQEFVKDIALNPLEGCVLLQVTCPHVLKLPSLMGCILVDVLFVNKQNRIIQMNCTFHSVNSEDKVQIIKVVIGPALSATVCDWWHPRYPYNLPVIIRHYRFMQQEKAKLEKAAKEKEKGDAKQEKVNTKQENKK